MPKLRESTGRGRTVSTGPGPQGAHPPAPSRLARPPRSSVALGQSPPLSACFLLPGAVACGALQQLCRPEPHGRQERSHGGPHPQGLSHGCAREEAGLPRRRGSLREPAHEKSSIYCAAPGTVLRSLGAAPPLGPQNGPVGHCHSWGGSGRLRNGPRSQPGNGRRQGNPQRESDNSNTLASGTWGLCCHGLQ